MRKFIVSGMLVVAALAASMTAVFAQEATETSATTSSAWLGIAVVEQNGEVVIARVRSGSPASAADLLIGDVVNAFDGTEIASASELGAAVQSAAAGDTVTLDLLRNGEAVSVEVTLGSRPTALRGDRPGRGLMGDHDPLMLAERLLGADLEAADEGYSVAAVSANRNPLALEVGDVITSVNGQAVGEIDLVALAQRLADMETPTLTLTVVREGETLTLETELMGGRFGFGGRGPGSGFGGHGLGNGGFGGRGPGNMMPPVAPDAEPVSADSGAV